MSSESMSAKPDESYDLELYKSLRKEAADYLEKIPAIWLQKFLFAGAVLAFVVAKPAEAVFAARSDEFIVAGFVCVPLLSLLLDVKIFEYSLHARAISRFIEIQYRHAPKPVAWEAALWGGGADRDIARLANYRSAATVSVTLVSTAVLIVLSGIVVGSLTRNMVPIVIGASIIAGAYVAFGVWSAIVIWPRLAARRSTM
ncbi:MAG TPA: hypothetical protein VNA69_18295 [Thermoanaerobaculia bacterium]|nr:hypothetical protein [Thermoanaerobaculia bacterium]